MKILGHCEVGAAILYERGDSVEIRTTRKRGNVIRIISVNDARLAKSTLIEVRLNDGSTVCVEPSGIIPRSILFGPKYVSLHLPAK